MKPCEAWMDCCNLGLGGPGNDCAPQPVGVSRIPGSPDEPGPVPHTVSTVEPTVSLASSARWASAAFFSG
jgi:hypothetical protein